MMRKSLWILQSLIIVECCYLVLAREPNLEQDVIKAESTTPIITLSPPEGNTTFLGGTSWCVARPGTSQADLQSALDWACGIGKANCGPIQKEGPCYEPETLLSHASYAFNSYYQQNGNSDVACNFGGTAILTKTDPSYGKCVYAASGSNKSSAVPLKKNKPRMLWWEVTVLIILFCMRL